MCVRRSAKSAALPWCLVHSIICSVCVLTLSVLTSVIPFCCHEDLIFLFSSWQFGHKSVTASADKVFTVVTRWLQTTMTTVWMAFNTMKNTLLCVCTHFIVCCLLSLLFSFWVLDVRRKIFVIYTVKTEQYKKYLRKKEIRATAGEQTPASWALIQLTHPPDCLDTWATTSFCNCR